MAFVHGAKTRLYFNDQHISGYSSGFTTTVNRNLAETTNLLAGGTTSIPGFQEGGMTIDGFMTTQIPMGTNFTDLLRNSSVVEHGVLSTAIPGTPAVGYPAFITMGDPTKYEIESKVDDAVSVSFEIQGEDGTADWGVLLADGSAITADGEGDAADAGSDFSPTHNGGVASLHVLAVDGDDPAGVVTIQHSADNTTFVDLVTFTALAGDTTSEFKKVAPRTTVNRYLRATFSGVTDSEASYNIVLAFARR